MNPNEPFLTHPSVRIKGTENNYDPLQCTDPSCPNRSLHMHCPFCIKTDSFQDPVILRAHYRVKHVDKGIDFAGLKILRCCDRCAILGSIKGNKEFKGAHWHCYKCKNGFNRRDEAIKHYRTHFRYPQTTFQIQVTQEVNQSMQRNEIEQATGSLHPMTVTLDSGMSDGTTGLMTVTADSTIGAVTNGRGGSDGEVHVSVAANETVGTTDGQTIMIIHEEPIAEPEETQEALTTLEIVHQDADSSPYEKEDYEQKLENLQHQCDQSEMEKSQIKAELEQARIQLQVQQDELSYLRQREQDLMSQLEIPLDDHVAELLTVLKQQHEELLHQQLAQLKKSFIHQSPPILTVQNWHVNSLKPGETVAQSFVVSGEPTVSDTHSEESESYTITLNNSVENGADSTTVSVSEIKACDIDQVSEISSDIKIEKRKLETLSSNSTNSETLPKKAKV